MLSEKKKEISQSGSGSRLGLANGRPVKHKKMKQNSTFCFNGLGDYLSEEYYVGKGLSPDPSL